MKRSILAAVALIGAGSAAFAQSPVQRGEYLVNSILNCGNCHTPHGPAGAEKPFAGGNLFDESPAFKVYSTNLTPDKETGLGNWTAAQIKRAIMEGVRPDGKTLAPIMPSGFYTGLTPRDADAIVAYLRSLKPVKNEIPAPQYMVPLKHAKLPAPGKLSRKEKRGHYLATIGHCMECHTPMEKGELLAATSLGTGGREFKGPWGVATSRNITSDKAKGLGSWTDAEIRRAITQGISKNGDKLKPPMGYAAYAKMSDKDLGDLIAYLRKVPAKQ